MDALTLAALCSLIGRHDAAPTAVPTGTDCATVLASAASNAAAAKRLVAEPVDREAIARVAWAEAANQGDAGLAAVVYTIINRLGSGRFGASIDAVLNAPRQFEPVSRAGGDWRALRTLPLTARVRLDAIIDAALAGTLPDSTGGAIYFQNAAIVAQRERAGQVSRGLTNFGGQRPIAVIGDHSFYADSRAGQGPRRQVSDSGVTDAWIDAGGSIFAGGSVAAFDAPTPAPEHADRVRTPDPVPEAQAPSLPAPRKDGAPTAVLAPAGGMFVLSDGQTSPAPR